MDSGYARRDLSEHFGPLFFRQYVNPTAPECNFNLHDEYGKPPNIPGAFALLSVPCFFSSLS